jgi:acetyl esterase/lipase
MKNLIHKYIMVRYMFVFLFFLSYLTFSQDNPEKRVDVDVAISTDLIPISFDSHGATLYGYFNEAHGKGPHPTVILLHGSPGGNRDVLGLAQAAPRAGWNVLVFNYRGFYESEGICSLKNSLEDVFSALNFIQSDEIVKKYRIDVDHIALAGYSYGGNIALTAAASDSSIKYVISIVAADISEIARQAKKSDEFRAMFVETMNNRILKGLVKGPGGKESLEELLANYWQIRTNMIL